MWTVENEFEWEVEPKFKSEFEPKVKSIDVKSETEFKFES